VVEYEPTDRKTIRLTVQEELPRFLPVLPIEVQEDDTQVDRVAVSDPGGDPITIDMLEAPDFFSADLRDELLHMQFSPDYHDAGTHFVKMRFTNQRKHFSTVQEMMIKVENVNAPPWLKQFDAISLPEGSRRVLTFKAEDPDGTVPEVTVEDMTEWMSFEQAAEGMCSLTLQPGYHDARPARYLLWIVATDQVGDPPPITYRRLPIQVENALQPLATTWVTEPLFGNEDAGMFKLVVDAGWRQKLGVQLQVKAGDGWLAANPDGSPARLHEKLNRGESPEFAYYPPEVGRAFRWVVFDYNDPVETWAVSGTIAPERMGLRYVAHVTLPA
jgi:hypothetical protein